MRDHSVELFRIVNKLSSRFHQGCFLDCVVVTVVVWVLLVEFGVENEATTKSVFKCQSRCSQVNFRSQKTRSFRFGRRPSNRSESARINS